MGGIEAFVERLAGLPPLALYLVIGTGAAVENVVPPIPADTFVLFGAFLAAAGAADPWVVFACTWIANVGAAYGVYGLARRYGNGFFQSRVGRILLHGEQLEAIGRFYARWGVPAIFVSRFLPAFRAMVPVFAGVAYVSFWRAAGPIAIASGLWYGTLVYLGYTAGVYWDAVLAAFGRISALLLWIAAPLLALLAVWWLVSRLRAR